MAGSKLNDKVSASTILEVVVSMVIIVVIFGIAMMIYVNISQASLSAKKIRAYAILNESLKKVERNPNIVLTSLTDNDFTIQEELNPYDKGGNLTTMHLTIFDINKQKIAELNKVILVKP